MATALKVSVDTKAVQAAIKRLAPWGEKVAADALQRVAYEVVADIQVHVGSIYTFAGPGTQKFLSGKGSWKFDRISPRTLTTNVYPVHTGQMGKRRVGILSQHTKSAAPLTAKSSGRLLAGHKASTLFAAPVKTAIKRNQRGKIKGAQLPTAMLGKRSFVSKSGKAIVERLGPKQYRVAYALMSRAENPRKLDVHGIALKTARRVFASKVARAIAKAKPR